MPDRQNPVGAARNRSPAVRAWRPDLASFAGLAVALAGIVGGLILEGGSLSDIRQFTAAMIVAGGTLGAVMITTPTRTLLNAVRSLPLIFTDRDRPREQMLAQIIGYAAKARKTGIVALDAELDSISDPFLRKSLMLAIDGTDIQELRSMMDLEIAMREHNREAVVKVYESAGGYAPTIGIIGAVLGLIQVMKNLANIEEVGRGIAVAFVATVYGVGLANILLLPAASKLRSRFTEEIKTWEMIVEGTVSLVEGLNPKLIQSKLEAFLDERAEVKEPGSVSQPSRQTASARG
jgi:chemotaxis protein MotA